MVRVGCATCLNSCIPFPDLLGGSGVGEDLAHFLCNCGPLGGSMQVDEGENYLVLLSESRST